jgi:hypothetical protein
VATNAPISASFDHVMDPSTLTATSFTVTCPTGISVTGAVSYEASNNSAVFTPAGSDGSVEGFVATRTLLSQQNGRDTRGCRGDLQHQAGTGPNRCRDGGPCSVSEIVVTGLHY